MKHLAFLSLSALLAFAACKKSNTNTPTNNNNNNNNGPTSPYYFKFMLNNDSCNYICYADSVKGYNTSWIFCTAYNNTAQNQLPSILLVFYFPHQNTSLAVNDSEIHTLQGLTMYFNANASDNFPAPSLTIDSTGHATSLVDYPESDSTNNVHISAVTFLKTDTENNQRINNYIIDGTCKARMTGNAIASLTSGNFHLLYKIPIP